MKIPERNEVCPHSLLLVPALAALFVWLVQWGLFDLQLRSPWICNAICKAFQ